jgi:HEAT repeat protein
MGTSKRSVLQALGGWLLASAALAQGEAKKALGLEFQGGARMAFEVPPQEGAKLLKEIAAARVALDVTGDLGSALRALDELTQRVFAAQGFEGQAEAMVQLALGRAEVHLCSRELELARATLRAAQPQYVRGPNLTLIEPTPAMLAARWAAQNDPRLAARLRELDAVAAEGPADQERPLEELIEKAAAEGRWDAILAIGPIAFEPFAKQALASAARFPLELDDEPLLPLLQLDERRAARFLSANLAAGGEPWKRRVLSAMQVRKVLDNRGTWTETPPHVCLEPEWLELVQAFLGERETAREALPFFAEIERRDALTDGLNAAFARALTFGGDFSTAAMQVFDHPGVVASAQPALEALLALSDVRLRRFAARQLVNLPSSPALLAYAGDADPELRRAVLASLLPRYGVYYRGEQLPPTHQVWHERALGPRERELVLRFLADPEDDLRARAVGVLAHFASPLEPAVLQQLLEDRAAVVRAQLVPLAALAPERQAEVLRRLASDPDWRVVQAIDKLLDNVADEPELFARGYLVPLEARWLNTERPLAPGLRLELRDALLQTAEGTRALVGWTLGHKLGSDFAVLAKLARTEHVLALPDELLARLLAATDTLQSWQEVWRKLTESPRVERPEALRLLLADAHAPRSRRLTAASLAFDESPAFRRELLRLLRDGSWRSEPPSSEERQLLRNCAGRLAPALRNELAAVVLEDEEIPFEVRDPFVAMFAAEGPGGPALAERALAQWFRGDAPCSETVSSILGRIALLPGLARPELLEQALPRYSHDVANAIAVLADARYLPLLARAMRAEWLPSNERDDLQQVAARALGSFDEDEAVELLLAGLRSDDYQVREECEESLARIKNYRAEVAAWRSREKATPTKENALGDLVAMLSDADPLVRKEAARGLAALGAVEVIPELIRLLKDSDAGVRAAAQQALDRLNATPAGG